MRRDFFQTVGDDLAAVLADRPKPKPKRSKATYDLPRSIIQAVNDIAQAEEVTRSDVVAWALQVFIKRYHAGNVDWTHHRKPAVNNPRATWKLVIPAHGGD